MIEFDGTHGAYKGWIGETADAAGRFTLPFAAVCLPAFLIAVDAGAT